MTMRELARLANVSLSTVSKAFSDADDISSDTKNQIFDIAKKYGCYGKFYKGKYKKKIIAIISHEFKSSYYSSFVEKLQLEIERNNCIALITSDHFDTQTQSELIEYFISYLRVDGIFVFNMREQLKKGYDIPIISLFNSKDETVDKITVSTSGALYDTIRKLKSLGHKKIAFIGEKLTVNKAQTFLDAIKQPPVAEGVYIESKYRFEKAGEEGIERLLYENPDCTAIICGYDNIAFGAIKELKKAGKSVPDDYSVIGIDNIDFSEYTEVSLSSIDFDNDKVCKKAWELMSNKLKNQYYHSYEPIVIEGKLIVKDSISKPRD